MSSVYRVQSGFDDRRAMWLVLGAGLVLSVGLHVGAGVGASAYFSRSHLNQDRDDSAMEVMPDSSRPIAEPEELKLGAPESSTASISWLGVIEKPQEGEAPIDEVEQAALTTQAGATATTAAPEIAVEPLPRPVEPIEMPIEMPAEEPVEEPIEEPIEKQVQTPALELELEPEPVAEPESVMLEPVAELENEAEVETEPETEPAIEPKPEAVEPRDEEAVVAQEVVEEAAKEESPVPAGKDGIESLKESAAAKLKKAIKVDGSKLHKPISAQGLEIITVEPKFPATVRFTELPKNPVVLIQFNAKGKVSRVEFLRDGRKVYDTGARSVDEPLVSALYQWRAKGKVIDELDPNDPKSVIEISMRITFRKESSVP